MNQYRFQSNIGQHCHHHICKVRRVSSPSWLALVSNEGITKTNQQHQRRKIMYKSNGKPRKCISLLIKLQASKHRDRRLSRHCRHILVWRTRSFAVEWGERWRAEQREFPVDWLHDEEIKYKNKSLYLHHIYDNNNDVDDDYDEQSKGEKRRAFDSTNNRV